MKGKHNPGPSDGDEIDPEIQEQIERAQRYLSISSSYLSGLRQDSIEEEISKRNAF